MHDNLPLGADRKGAQGLRQNVLSFGQRKHGQKPTKVGQSVLNPHPTQGKHAQQNLSPDESAKALSKLKRAKPALHLYPCHGSTCCCNWGPSAKALSKLRAKRQSTVKVKSQACVKLASMSWVYLLQLGGNQMLLHILMSKTTTDSSHER
ncbi:hypothetical protein DUNSADRAFT_13786 [Dunaliella salina]|uniref:Encoded protein n=1 Tax=Dunaliella salina TaxID=3046 RepID=A0ABQ7G8Q7_DUNSA|nr:hypothetical protein DUNSADRAFT_13786 [Dunaliella salina]|eukprot:KAF5830976.1 hypothetical protein DUNSADRAFT_13786 [Dunaliella salina]